MNEFKEGEECWAFTTESPHNGRNEFWGEFNVNNIYLHRTNFDEDDDHAINNQIYFKSKSEAISAMIKRLNELTESENGEY